MRLGTFFLLSVSLLVSGVCRSQPVIVNGNFEADGEQSPRFVPSGWMGGTPTGAVGGQGAPEAVREDLKYPTLAPPLENPFGGRGWMVGWALANASDTISQEVAVEVGKTYRVSSQTARYYGGFTGPPVQQASVALKVDYTGDSEYDTTVGVLSGANTADFTAEKTPIKVTFTITGYYEEDQFFLYSTSGGVIDNVAIQEIPPSDTITIPTGNSPPVTFGYTGVTMDFLSNTVAGDVTVDVVWDPPYCPPGSTLTSRYWSIYGLQGSSFQVHITFNYTDEEISAAGLDESNLTIWWEDLVYSYGPGTSRQLETYLNTTANTIRTKFPQTGFGSFYVAEKRPQATVTVPAGDPPPISFGNTGLTIDFPEGGYATDVTVTKNFGPSECLGSDKVGYWHVLIMGEPWFDATAVMTFEYTDDEILAAGLDETKLSMWHPSYGSAEWIQLESLVDPVANTITAIVDAWFWETTFAISEGPPRWTIRVPVGDVAPLIFGNTGVTIDFSSNDTEGDVTVITIWGLPPGLANAIGVHWDISGLSPGTFEGVITFTYSDMNVFLAFLEESSLRLWKSEGAGVWIEVASVLDTEANTITTAVPQSSFSLWAIAGELSVTAVDNWEVFR